MFKNLGNKRAADLFHKGTSKSISHRLIVRTVFLLDIMEAVDSLEILKSKGFPPSLRLHKLKGSLKNEFTIDINKLEGWRITFKFDSSEFVDVKVESYH